MAEQALTFFRALYDIEREVRVLPADERRRIRPLKAKRIADDLRTWLMAQRQKMPERSAITKAIGYGRNRRVALRCYLAAGR